MTHPLPSAHIRALSSPGRPREGGFTLVELVTVILILGVLAAVALPRYADVSSQTRIAKVQHMAGTLKTTIAMVKARCMMVPGCANYPAMTSFTADGRQYGVIFGYPEAGDWLGTNQIDTMVEMSGFVATIPDSVTTKFAVDEAPDTANCAVTYRQAITAGSTPAITTATSGC